MIDTFLRAIAKTVARGASASHTVYLDILVVEIAALQVRLAISFSACDFTVEIAKDNIIANRFCVEVFYLISVTDYQRESLDDYAIEREFNIGESRLLLMNFSGHLFYPIKGMD